MTGSKKVKFISEGISAIAVNHEINLSEKNSISNNNSTEGKIFSFCKI